MRILRLRQHKLHADPQQKRPAHNFQERQIQQQHGKRDENHAQDDGAGGTPENALKALFVRQVAARKRNHDGVVAA